MKSVWESPQLRQEQIEKGTRILSQYTIADMANKFQHLYERVAAKTLSKL